MLFYVSVVLLIAGLGLICCDPTVNVHIKRMAGNYIYIVTLATVLVNMVTKDYSGLSMYKTSAWQVFSKISNSLTYNFTSYYSLHIVPFCSNLLNNLILSKF